MHNAFISYSSKDEEIAMQLHGTLKMAGINPFMAALSITPGTNWSEAIFENLKKANWVFFLATKNACESQTVQQELGASLASKKTIIPILVDIKPEELPGRVNRYQAIDIQKAPEALHSTIEKISEQIKVDKFWTGVVIGVLVIGLICTLKNKITK